jgi:hypothetical protein
MRDQTPRYLSELATKTEARLTDEKLMERLDVKYDIINLGSVPPRP